MKILGLIPARGGSVRIPRKNLAELGGFPLIAWTIDAAHQSRAIDWLMCSTDDAEIASQARYYGVNQVIERPAHLSRGDQPHQLTVIRHALQNVNIGGFDVLLLLQPTSPFRTPSDIVAVVHAMVRGARSAITVIRGSAEPNGAIYAARIKDLRLATTLYDDESTRVLMPDDHSIDIDTPDDLEEARRIVAAKWGETS